MKAIYQLRANSKAADENIVIGKKYRITVLTERLIRLEYSEDNVFEDRMTQIVFERDFDPVNYKIVRNEKGIEIITPQVHLYYNEKNFSKEGLRIHVLGNLPSKQIWNYSDPIHDLKGTARTLDEADGQIPVESGLVSRYGYSLLDDSDSIVLLEDGWVEPRKEGIKDIYFWGYGHDYKACLKDFYKLSGKIPMLPRFALGNWWSRYYTYTEESFNKLMNQFEEQHLPFTVAVIDMDWHLVDVDPKYGTGWTGYTWNKELFPDPEHFLKSLKKRGLHTTINVHPADGVREFEKPYLEIAKAMGVNYEEGEPVQFDPSNPKFMEEYFRCLHHPLEEQGVDFWWVDWQQGNNSNMKGLDPLWILNHFHFLDSKKDGKRPLTFSRYAGPGSHRYPVGFSGDTITTWESLDFQPYFTATASNIGYGWWSHDIGGHMFGYQDNEMVGRWTWLGVFSPIMRLHSSNSLFSGKEPWRFGKETEAVMGEALRLRHRMIPYLYTMNHRCYEKNLPIVLPMYYEHPQDKRAYEVPNQYYFGSDLLVMPITTKGITKLNVAKVKAFLPEGRWYDIFTGYVYQGDRMLSMHRDVFSIPVLAKEGSILPMTDEIFGTDATKNPNSLHIYVYAGASGSFTLYEDDNETCSYEVGNCVKTRMTYEDKINFVIQPSIGNLDLAPKKRNYIIEFTGYKMETEFEIRVDGNLILEDISRVYDDTKRAIRVTVNNIMTTSELTIQFLKAEIYKENNLEKHIYKLLNHAEIDYKLKDEIFQLVTRVKDKSILLGNMFALELDYELMGALTELITG